MSRALFIADLHLSPERPNITRLFFQFLKEQAGRDTDLYILGDLFDAWIGDDNPLPEIKQIYATLKSATDAGLNIHIMHGNRDFLIGEQFQSETGCRLIDDPTTLKLGEETVLLMHGDLLCSDDVEYQQARKILRNPAFIADFISKSIPERIALAAEYRKKSGEVISLKSADIMDVNQSTVEQTMEQYQAQRLIHGHTHRPHEHHFQLNGSGLVRHVLQDWSETAGGYLVYENGNYQAVMIR